MPAASPVRPLSPWTYLLRNLRRIWPLFAIQALVTSLLVLIITPTNAFRATAEANIRPLEIFTIVTPRLRSDFDEELLRILDANPALERRVAAKMFWIRTPMIVGEGYAPVIALPEDVWPAFMEKAGSRLVAGRLPKAGEDGAVLHRAVAHARDLELGEAFGQLVDPKDSTPGRFTLVGLIDGDSRLGMVDLEYASQPFFVLARRDPFQLIYAKPGRKAESDAYLRAARHDEDPDEDPDEDALRVVDHRFVSERIDETFRNLPLVIGFITTSVALVVALVISLLNVIAFQVRIDEFGLFLAVGHPRARLVRKLAAETALVAGTSWVVGLGAGLLGVLIYKHVSLDPKGIIVEVVDPRPLLFSLSVPVLSTLTGAVALGRRLHRMDPVAVIQRRGT
jgi:hypothetical protein